MRIDCTSCEMYRSEHCSDCLVTAMLHSPTESIDIDEDLDASLQALSGAGLIPVLKFRPRADTPGAGVQADTPGAGIQSDTG